MSALARVLLYALVIAGVMNLLNHAPLGPGFRGLFTFLSADGFLVFGSATAIAVFNQKHLCFLLLGITLLAAWPFNVSSMAAELTPFSAGILLGAATRHGIEELHGTTNTDH